LDASVSTAAADAATAATVPAAIGAPAVTAIGNRRSSHRWGRQRGRRRRVGAGDRGTRPSAPSKLLPPPLLRFPELYDSDVGNDQ